MGRQESKRSQNASASQGEDGTRDKWRSLMTIWQQVNGTGESKYSTDWSNWHSTAGTGESVTRLAERVMGGTE